MPTFTDSTPFGLVMRFEVDMAGMDLGAWSSCDGLRIDFGLKEIREGGNNDFKVYLLDRLYYPRLVLRQAMSARDSTQVMSWLRKMVDATEGDTATVTLRDSHAATVAEWTFANVRPMRVEGPTLSSSGKEGRDRDARTGARGFL